MRAIQQRSGSVLFHDRRLSAGNFRIARYPGVFAIDGPLFRYPLRTAIAVAAGLTQIGELSFVVVQVARSVGLVAEDLFSTVIAASLVSILLNVLVVRATFAWLGSHGHATQTPNSTGHSGKPEAAGLKEGAA